mgnify:CR=1 FL=1
MVAILALLLPPPAVRLATMGGLSFAVATLMVLMVQGFDLLHNDADEVSPIRIG